MTPVPNVGAIGIVKDLPLNELPLNAWTDGRNVRFIDGAVEKFSGHAEVYATPNVAPYWLLPIASATAYFWLYAGLLKVGATDGTTHADITRAVGGNYSTDANVGWTGTTIEGIAVINNAADVPQMWTPSLANDLTALTAWDATWRARSLRGLKRYLVALDISKGATRFPYMIKWSDEAPPGGVPASWDETLSSIDAGEWQLSSEGGFLIDSIPLRDDLIIYREFQTWLMQFVGGIDVFRFTKKFDTIGALTRRSAVEFFSGKHVVFTGDDIVLHDGQQAESLLTERARTLLLGRVDSTNYGKSFVALNVPKTEVWTCFPEVGSTLCNKAIVWNWKKNTIGLRDLPNVAFIATGIVNPVAATETWAGVVGDWDSDSAAWGDRSYDPSQRKMLIAGTNDTKLFQPDQTEQFNGVNMTSFVEKRSIGFPLKADAPPDYTNEKLLRGVWPRIAGTAGGVVNVYVGTQERIDGPVTYDPAFPFIIGSTEYVDCLKTSKLHALKFESTSSVQWKLHGYDADVVLAGKHGSR